jgi:8-oxo-dGTP pyrophosphatase MutT (NUDIX family)/2'-5' RNA ligase
VIARLPEPVASHVQAWRRALLDPSRAAVGPHLTLVPPQTVAAEQVDRAVALLERAAGQAVPCLVALDGAATFLPTSPVAYLVVREGGPALSVIEQALRSPPLERRTHRFHPHVTVAQDRPEAVLRAAVRDLAGFRATFPVQEIALMRETGRVWRPLASARVGASPAARAVPFAEAASALLFLLAADPPKVLLGLRTREPGRRYPGAWDPLGGKPEPGETLLEGLVREVGEEAGIEPLDVAALGCFSDGERADAFYVATAWRGEPRNTEPAEHVELAWVSLWEAQELRLTPTTRAALGRLLEAAGPAAPPAFV